MPFSAALSSALTALRSWSVDMDGASVPNRRTRLTSVFTAERVARFRFRLRADDRTRFFAERVFAMRRLII
jgi:hypothetical protein